jgi:ATP-dependent exoDNAse (exonuclease V) alpha subunit
MKETPEDFSDPKLHKKEGGTLSPMPGIYQNLEKMFPFVPTDGQRQLFRLMEKWLLDKDSLKPTFILRGYAGTGKTAFLGTLVKILPKLGLQVQLMAPTGRASKVMSSYTRKLALTIHKRIFRYETDEWGYPSMKRQKNSFHKTLFIVDEASMLGNKSEYGVRGILEELISYVFENKGNKLLIIGDIAQLPPIGTDLSLALKAEEMRMRFGLTVMQHELSDVVRQELDSGILENATALREIIRGKSDSFLLKTSGFQDIFKMKANRVFEGIDYAYQKYGMEKTLVVTRTNKQAMGYNRGIRQHILFREEELESGDWIIIVKNNYSVVESDSKLGFLANGDLATVSRVGKHIDDYPLRLIKMQIRISESEEEEDVDCIAFAELLYSDLPQLSEEQLKTYNQVLMAEWGEEEKNQKKLWAKLKTDPFANALQIKFGYALTCHKAQGGQWDAVFIDHGFLKEGPLDTEFYRWFYTAVTRARKEVFIIEPDGRLMGENAKSS